METKIICIVENCATSCAEIEDELNNLKLADFNLIHSSCVETTKIVSFQDIPLLLVISSDRTVIKAINRALIENLTFEGKFTDFTVSKDELTLMNQEFLVKVVLEDKRLKLKSIEKIKENTFLKLKSADKRRIRKLESGGGGGPQPEVDLFNPDGSITKIFNCEAHHHTVEGSGKCLSGSCGQYGGQYYHKYDSSSKTCVTGCNPDYGFRDGHTCKTNCSSYMVPTSSHFDNWNERGTCVGSCNISNYVLTYNPLKYTNNVVKNYCLSSCFYSNFNLFYQKGSQYFCTNNCRAEHAAVPTQTTITTTTGASITSEVRYQLGNRCYPACEGSNYFITSVQDFNTAEEWGSCTSSCNSPSFYLNSDDFKYNSGVKKHFCLSACDQDDRYTLYFISGTQKLCVDDCRQEAATNWMNSNLRYKEADGNMHKCINSCNSTHVTAVREWNTALEDGECVSECPADEYELTIPGMTFPDGSTKIYCLSTCEHAPYLYHYIHSDKLYCSDHCLEEYSSLSMHSERRYAYEKDGKFYCTHECPFSHRYVANPGNFNQANENGECVSECPDTKFKLIDSSFKYNHDAAKIYCLRKCPENFAIIDWDKRECQPGCDPNSVRNYYSKTRTCEENCQDAGYAYTMEDLSCSDGCSDYTFKNIFCVTECPSSAPYLYGRTCLSVCPSQAPYVLDFKMCVSSCPIYTFNQYCTDSCTSLTLEMHYASIGFSFPYRPYILSTGICSPSCSEGDYPYINEITLSCIPDCPVKCTKTPCEFKDLIYTDPERLCSADCDKPQYPLKDNISLECLNRCKAERPFIYKSECLAECPSDVPLLKRRYTCEDKSCGTECTTYDLLCTADCPKDAPFKLVGEHWTTCVCQCPQYFEPVNGICILTCNPELGLIEDEEKTTCLNCYRDLDKTFFYQTGCVENCPEKTAPDKHFVCRPCIDLNLWTDADGLCIPFPLCDPLSHFIYPTKECLECSEEGYILVKRFNSIFTCEKNDCSSGKVVVENGVPICVICQNKEFLQGSLCTPICEENLKFNFYDYQCLKCSGPDCCLKGKPSKEGCKCDESWAGKYCSTPNLASSKVFDDIFTFLKKRMSKSYLKNNENELISELILLNSAISRRRLDKTKSLIELADVLFDYIERAVIQYAYQADLMQTIDIFVGLGLKLAQETEDWKYFVAGCKLFYRVSNDVQIFNSTIGAVANFKVIDRAQYDGDNFYLSFGTNIDKESRVNIDACLSRIRLSLGLSFTYLFHYRLIYFSSNIKQLVPDSVSFKLSDIPIGLLTLYVNGEEVKIDSYCDQKFADTRFVVVMEDTTKAELAQQLKEKNIDSTSRIDPFFNDRCLPPLDSDDLTIAKKKEKYFIDPVEVCNESSWQVCEIESLDAEGNAVCFCAGIKNKPKASLQTFFSGYPESNYILVKCITVFLRATITQNAGFYSLLMPSFPIIVALIYFLIKTSYDLENQNKFIFIRNDVKFFDPACMNETAYFNECNNLMANLVKLKIRQRIKRRLADISEEELGAVPTLADLEALSPVLSIALDSRSDWRFAKDIFMTNQNLFKAFLLDSLVTPKPFTLLMVMTEINVATMLNCFFIDDTLVNKYAENRETHSVATSLAEELPKTIWAVVTAKIFVVFLKLLYRIDKKQKAKLQERVVSREKFGMAKAFSDFMNFHRTRLILFLTAVTVINCFFLYFVVIYTELYSGSISIWINGIIIGCIVDYILLQSMTSLFIIGARIVARRFPSLKIVFVGLVTILRKASLNKLRSAIF